MTSSEKYTKVAFKIHLHWREILTRKTAGVVDLPWPTWEAQPNPICIVG
jgi:hypothetical protein